MTRTMPRLLASLVLCVALLLPGMGWAAIAVDQRAVGTAVSGVNTQTLSCTVNAASPFFVGVTFDTSTVSDVTWNGSSMGTALDTKIDSAGSNNIAVYAMKSPATGTHDVVVTWAGNVGSANIFCISTTGGDTTTGWRSIYTRVGDAGGTGPGTTVIDSQNGDLVIHAAQVFGTTITFDGGEDTTNTEDDAINGGSNSAGMSTKAATGANTAVGCTDTTYYSEIAFAVIPAAGGAPDVSQFRKRVQ